MRPSQQKIRRAKVHASSSDYTHLVYLSPKKRSRKIQALPKIYAPHGQRFIQHHNLPIPPGQLGLLERIPGATESWIPSANSHVASGQHTVDNTVFHPVSSLHQRKRIAQNNRWNTEVIPQLVRPYLALMRKTQNLRIEAPMLETECTCLMAGKNMSILVLRLYSEIVSVFACYVNLGVSIGLEHHQMHVCECSPAAVQLVKQGLFPCAPLFPTLAVDIRVLQLITGIFLRMSPNNTAIADTLQDFLDSRGYKLQGQVIIGFINVKH